MEGDSNQGFYHLLLQRIVKVAEAQRGFIVALDPDTGLLLRLAAHNWDDSELHNEEKRAAESFVHKVIASGKSAKTINYELLQNAEKYQADGRFPFPLRSILCCPMQIGQRRGAVYVDLRIKLGLYTKEDVARVEALLGRSQN